ncbi:hypothetical protein OMR07_20530 [Methylobacterium organophilum]|nr:hypothetical protein [Methylobacterium organophilum]
MAPRELHLDADVFGQGGGRVVVDGEVVEGGIPEFEDVPHDFHVQPQLAVEVVVHVGLGQPGAAGDGVHAGALEAVAGEFLGSRGEDGFLVLLAKLAGGVAVIKVGAGTEVEMKEKKARVEDALHATRAAVEEGVVPGGGVALVRALQAISELKGDNEDQNVGIALLRRAVEAPLRQIVSNAGGEPSVVVDKVKQGSGNYGFNAASDTYGDMIEMGILDPAKVTRAALQAAASIGGLMVTTEAMVAEVVEDKPAPAMPDMGGMGGMGGMM